MRFSINSFSYSTSNVPFDVVVLTSAIRHSPAAAHSLNLIETIALPSTIGIWEKKSLALSLGL